MWNLIYIVYEDDRDLRSSFSWDLTNLSGFTKYKDICVTIIFHSKKIHGDFEYHIKDGHINMIPIAKIKDSDTFIQDMIRNTKKYFKPNYKNGIFFSSHCYKKYIRPFSKNESFAEWVKMLKDNHMQFEFILFDCCYMMSLDCMIQFYKVTKYMIGCETASPYLSFNSAPVPDIFNKWKHNTALLLSHLVDAYISRNNETPFRRIKYFTDGVVLDLKYLPHLMYAIQQVTFVRNSKALVEPTPQYTDLFDLWSLVDINKQLNTKQKQYIKTILNKIIIKYKQSVLLENKYWAHRLHGLSIVLKHTSQTGAGNKSPHK